MLTVTVNPQTRMSQKSSCNLAVSRVDPNPFLSGVLFLIQLTVKWNVKSNEKFVYDW
jgi:hypothetical protein